jgi:glycosyltransferase involved in cell wall biosynthesis
MRLVTPSYQQGRFIEQTIRSVQSQSWPGLTYFIADGGSTDETVDVLRRLLEPHQWRSFRDQGQTASLAEAFEHGNEEILAWVNSDDYLLPGALSQVVQEFTRDQNIAIVHGDGIFVDEQGAPLTRCASIPIDSATLEEINPFVQASTFVRRRWYERVGGLDVRLSKVFDYDLFARIVKAGGRCRYVPANWSAYRLHAAGQTTALWRDFVPEMLAVQWQLGDRRGFARRYAGMLSTLCGRAAMTPQEARQFLNHRLDQLLELHWRQDAPERAVSIYFQAESRLRGVLGANNWPQRLDAAVKAMAPRNLLAVGSWMSHVATTGHLPALWRAWRLAVARREPIGDG